MRIRLFLPLLGIVLLPILASADSIYELVRKWENPNGLLPCVAATLAETGHQKDTL